MKGISRIDSARAVGWFVRVYFEGHIHAKFFSDSVHGGKRKALQAAKKHKAEYERTLPEIRRPYFTRLPKNNKTGVVGVSENLHKQRNGTRLKCYIVSWNPRPNLLRTKRFYLYQYETPEDAFHAAVQFRKEREQEINESVKRGRYK